MRLTIHSKFKQVKIDSAQPIGLRAYRSSTTLSGPIAPWFGQPGGAQQFLSERSIADLVAAGILRVLN